MCKYIYIRLRGEGEGIISRSNGILAVVIRQESLGNQSVNASAVSTVFANMTTHLETKSIVEMLAPKGIAMVEDPRSFRGKVKERGCGLHILDAKAVAQHMPFLYIIRQILQPGLNQARSVRLGFQ
jgi:hypothetical protein